MTRINCAEIANLVCAEYGFDDRALLDENARSSPEAGRVAAYLMHEMGKSSSQIGRALERDHSTILIRLKKIRRDMEENGQLAARVAKLLHALKTKADASYDPKMVFAPGTITETMADIRRRAEAKKVEADRRAQLREWIKKLRRRGFSENGLVRWSGLPREEVKAIIDGVVMP